MWRREDESRGREYIPRNKGIREKKRKYKYRAAQPKDIKRIGNSDFGHKLPDNKPLHRTINATLQAPNFPQPQ